MIRSLIQTISLSLFFVFSTSLSAQLADTLYSVKDVTLYQNANGSLANGAGQYMFVGNTGQSSSINTRRALLEFDFSSIPANAVIDSVQLVITYSGRNAGGSQDIKVHTLTSSWGEGSSVAGGQQGSGGTAVSNDATWIHTFFNTATWNNSGGDFNSSASDTASAVIFGGDPKTLFSGPGLTADVTAWIEGTLSNNGWLLQGNELSSNTSIRFFTREVGTVSDRPQLIVYYSITSSVDNKSQSESEVKLFPNPASEKLNFLVEKNLVGLEFQIMDLSGRRVYRSVINATDMTIEISDLKKGVYTLLLENEDGFSSYNKFVINR